MTDPRNESARAADPGVILDDDASVEARSADSTAPTPAPVCDYAEAERFLRLLAPDSNAVWCFRTFPDAINGTGRNYTGTLAEHWPTLLRDNVNGRGVFVVVNAGGHKDRDITRIRSVFVDLDGADLDAALEAVKGVAPWLEPGAIVSSSPGRWHVYWPTPDLPVADFTPVQKRLIQLTDADKSVHNEARVMRLPGTVHRKAAPYLVHVQYADPAAVAPADALLRALARPVVAPPPAPAPAPRAESAAPTEPRTGNLSGTVDRQREHDRQKLRRRADGLRSAVEAELRATPEGGRNPALNRRAYGLAGQTDDRGNFLFTDAEIRESLSAAALAAGLEPGEIDATLTSGITAGRLAPYALRDRPRASTSTGSTSTGSGIAGGDGPETIRQRSDGDRPQLRLIRSVIDADLPEHEERSVLGPYLPRGEVTLLAGHGGSGKTTLTGSWAVAVSAGVPWASAAAEPGRVLFASFEDPAPRVRSLLRRACRAADLPVSAAERVDLVDGTEAPDGALWSGDDKGARATPTRAAGELERAILEGGYSLVIVDNASETYDANENARRDVRGFLRWLRTLARAADCSVLLLAHVNAQTARNGDQNGQSFSGSTQWHNSVRSRLAIADGRLLHQKRQYGAPVEDLPLRFTDDGVLVPVGVVTEKRRAEQPRPLSEEDAERKRVAEEAERAALVLDALKRAAANGDWCSAGRKGPRNAYATAKQYGVDLAPAAVWLAVEQLQADGRLTARDVPAKGDVQRRLQVTESGAAVVGGVGGVATPLTPATPQRT